MRTSITRGFSVSNAARFHDEAPPISRNHLQCIVRGPTFRCRVNNRSRISTISRGNSERKGLPRTVEFQIGYCNAGGKGQTTQELTTGGAQRPFGLGVALLRALLDRLGRQIAAVEAADLFGTRDGNDPRDADIATLLDRLEGRVLSDGVGLWQSLERRHELGDLV